ncbi:MAG: hypothetical protein KA226_08920 [Gemmatimonadales bacterium]|nr:hypothetical protein [Gemmatimonadales bacterium]MBP7621044.1 hypothetical protein [Gemmatimonadales bacterium]
MSRRLLCSTAFLVGLAACHGEEAPSPTGVASAPTTTAVEASPRERLALRLAVALNDPATRTALKRKLDASHAPEGKLQFQALARADQGLLLASLARDNATSVADLLGDLDAARPLEVYLPVESHRRAWQGEATLLVATIGRDGEAPVAYDLAGHRRVLSADAPPSVPVLALVPQETDFTGGRPLMAASCYDLCGSTSTGATSNLSSTAGLYLTTSHFEDSFESWLKGKPEYEYHVYGLVAGSEAEQLSCTGEHAGGYSTFDQNGPDWSGSAMLLSEQERQRYAAAHPGAPIRIVAYEDDDEACVPRIDGNRVTQLLSAVDAAYKSVTSGKVEPWYVKGVRAAPSLFNLYSAVRNVITTGDDLIGNAVETSVAGWVPGGANWVLKSDGTRTYGWFGTAYRP